MKKCAKKFTLIELLVITSQICRDIFKRSVSRYQNTPLFSYERTFVKLYLQKNRKILR